VRITIIQRGALKDKQIQPLVDTYAKRFQRYGKLTISEQKKPQWSSGHFRILCDERGEQPSSEIFAKNLEKWSMQHGGICFAVGDADGHEQEFAAQAQYKFSLSAMVFPHRLAHLLLVEQLYRAACIQVGHPYHHA
jgi:23S rRNA (pseudouridine1915-N3)-methyltransferase